MNMIMTYILVNALKLEEKKNSSKRLLPATHDRVNVIKIHDSRQKITKNEKNIIKHCIP